VTGRNKTTSADMPAPTPPAPIPFVRDLEIEYGRVDAVSPLVRRVVAKNPSKFTYLGTGTYLVGHGEVAVIDPGPAIDEHVAAIIGALQPGERITHVLVTHTHSDHSPGAALLRSLGIDAPTYGFGPHGEVPPDDESDRIVFGDPEADWSDEKVKAAKDKAERAAKGEPEPRHDELREGADTDFVPDIVLRHGDVVNGGVVNSGGWTIEAVHTPGHTSNHLCFALREERALFPGDHVMGWSTSVIGPPDGSLRQYLASLRLLLDRDDTIYWPTHGPAITNPHELVRGFLAHREFRNNQIVYELGHGADTIAELVRRIYAAVNKKLWLPAAASTYAALIALIEDGRVVTDGAAPRRTGVYRAAP
jgi:glyoxylase-like metal-dependent hydrolase (beta-lactamase superfamily II)